MRALKFDILEAVDKHTTEERAREEKKHADKVGALLDIFCAGSFTFCVIYALLDIFIF